MLKMAMPPGLVDAEINIVGVVGCGCMEGFLPSPCPIRDSVVDWMFVSS